MRVSFTFAVDISLCSGAVSLTADLICSEIGGYKPHGEDTYCCTYA